MDVGKQPRASAGASRSETGDEPRNKRTIHIQREGCKEKMFHVTVGTALVRISESWSYASR